MEKINVAELLKDCPKGMELDCTMYNKVTLLKVDEDAKFPIKVSREDGTPILITKYGQYTNADFAKCIIFPKGKTTWEGFQRPFKDGDIVTWKDRGALVACIYKERKNTSSFYHHIALYKGGVGIIVNSEIALMDNQLRLATEEEKQKLFDAMKDNGYKWNPETKTLEKLVEPKFKVGENTDKALAPDLKGEDYSGKRFGYKIPNGYEFDCIQNNEIILKPIKPQYPKTYIECAKILDCFSTSYIDGYKNELLEKLQELLICRDAYWKIAGEQMELGKSWEPDWTDSNFKYCLKKMGNNIEKSSEMTISCILAFPTKEMRDAFYKNFKELIEQCKELL